MGMLRTFRSLLRPAAAEEEEEEGEEEEEEDVSDRVLFARFLRLTGKQWVPRLPPAARAALASHATGPGACFAALYFMQDLTQDVREARIRELCYADTVRYEIMTWFVPTTASARAPLAALAAALAQCPAAAPASSSSSSSSGESDVKRTRP